MKYDIASLKAAMNDKERAALAASLLWDICVERNVYAVEQFGESDSGAVELLVLAYVGPHAGLILEVFRTYLKYLHPDSEPTGREYTGVHFEGKVRPSDLPKPKGGEDAPPRT